MDTPKMKGQSKLTEPKVILLQESLRNAKMQGMPKSLVIWVPPTYMLACYCFFNSGQPDRYKIKRQSKLTKFKANLLTGRDQKCQNVGVPKSLVIQIPPSHMFVCCRFRNSLQPNGYKIKRQSKLSTKSKVILLRKRLEMPKYRGYPNPQ